MADSFEVVNCDAFNDDDSCFSCGGMTVPDQWHVTYGYGGEPPEQCCYYFTCARCGLTLRECNLESVVAKKSPWQLRAMVDPYSSELDQLLRHQMMGIAT